MDKKQITEILLLSKECAKDETEFKKETFMAVSLGLIMRSDTIFSQDKISASADVSIGNTNKKLSLREVILEKNPQNNLEKALCIAYYEEQYNGKKSWTTQDLVQGFKDAKEPIPTNPSDTVFKCKIKAWVMDTDGGFMLTKLGEQTINNGFGSKSKE